METATAQTTRAETSRSGTAPRSRRTSRRHMSTPSTRLSPPRQEPSAPSSRTSRRKMVSRSLSPFARYAVHVDCCPCRPVAECNADVNSTSPVPQSLFPSRNHRQRKSRRARRARECPFGSQDDGKRWFGPWLARSSAAAPVLDSQKKQFLHVFRPCTLVMPCRALNLNKHTSSHSNTKGSKNLSFNPLHERLLIQELSGINYQIYPGVNLFSK